MADDIADVGIRVDTDDVSKGIKALDALAGAGPKVEKSLQGVETASTKTGKSLATLGQGGSDAGLAKVAKSGKDAADSVGKLADTAAKTAAAVKAVDKSSGDTARAISGVSTAVKALVTSNEAVAASIRGVATAENAYLAKLQEETRQLRATIAERDKYVAQAQGMLTASKDIAAAIGGQVGALRQAEAATTQTSESMLALVRTGVGAFLGGAVVSGAKAAATAIYEASAAGERLRTTLNFATGGKSAEEIDYLRKVTNRLGLEFDSTARAYGSFQAAAKGTALEGQKARDVFESIAKASAVMGLTTEQSSGALLALQQMISKGTVQAEELRGQLGERLPGAFQIAAKAMGVTTAELGKMLEAGTVVADDFLPKFARAMNENIGEAAESAADRLDAATNRFGNAWERLKQRIGDAGVSKAVQNEIKAITDDVTVFGETMDKVGKNGGGFLAQIGAASAYEAGRLGFSLLNGSANLLNGTLNTLTGNFAGFLKLRTDNAYLPDFLKTDAQQAAALEQNLARAEGEFAKLKAAGGTAGGNVYWQSELFQISEYIRELKAAKAERDKLSAPSAFSQAKDSAAADVSEAARMESVRAAMQKVQQGLAGVKDSFFKDLNALKAGYDAGLLKLDAYQAAVKKLIDEDGGGKAVATALKASNKELTDQKKLILELAGLTGDFSEDWAKLSAAQKSGAISMKQLEEQQEKLLAKQPAIKAAREKEIELAKRLYAEQVQASEEISAAYVAESKAREQGRLAVNEYGRAIDEQNALTQFELGLVGRTQQARDVALAQYRIELDLKKQIQAIDKNAGFDEAQRIEERAKVREAAARAIANAETRAYVDEWNRATDKINDALTDALLRGFESGKDFASNLRDTVVNMFKTMVLKPVIQAVLQPAAGTASGLLNSLIGPVLGTGQAAASGGLSGVGSIANIGSLISSLNGGIGNLLSGTAGGLGSLMQGAGDWLTGGLGNLSTGPFADIGGWLSSTGNSLGASGGGALLGNGLGYAGALYSLTQGKYGAAAGAGIGTFFGGPIGAAIGSAIGSAVDKIFSGGAGTPHMGADYISTATGGYRPGANEVGIYSAGASVNQYRSQGVEDALKVLTGTGAGLLNSLATSFGKAANYAVGGYFAADNNDPAQANTRITAGGQTISSTATRYGVSGAKEGMDAFTAELAGQVRAALRSMDIPDWAQSQLDALAGSAGFEELANAVASITATKQALEQLGAVMPQLSDLTGGAVDGLLKAFSGIDGLKTAASAYYENFYSDAEKSASATAALTKELAAFGIAVPSSREAYRQLVEAQDLNTESGRAAYAELLKLSPAFAALVPVTAQLAQEADNSAAAMQAAAQKMAEAGRKVLADLADQQSGLQVELLRAQGDLVAAAELERRNALAKLTEGLTAQDAGAAAAAYDLNAALRDQIAALKDAASAAQQAAQAEAARAAAEAQRIAAVAQERAGLETQILQLEGNKSALRAQEIAAVDESNRVYVERIHLLQDEQAEQQRLVAVANERYNLDGQYLQLIGDTAALRERELLATDESNRAKLREIFALQDQKVAQDAATKAAQESAAALQQAAQAEQQRLAAIASERDGLIGRLLQAQGDTVAIRQRERDATDEANRAILDQIYALEDKRAADEIAAQAARDAAQAAEQLRSAWQSITDSLLDEVRRIRGLDAANSPQNFAAAQADFFVKSAQARAGDQEAAKLLPSLSEALLSLAQGQLSSAVDLRILRAQIAASLGGTADSLAGRYGLTLPHLATGTNNVPQDMVAMLHQGEAVVPRAYNPSLAGADMQKVVDAINKLAEQQTAQMRAVVLTGKDTLKVVKQWDQTGLPKERQEANA